MVKLVMPYDWIVDCGCSDTEEEQNVTKIVWGRYPISRMVTEGILSRATVVWRFERGADVMRLTASKDTKTGEHVLQIVDSGRSELTERYQRYPEYLARILTLDQRLTDQYWSQVEVQQRYPAPRQQRAAHGRSTRSGTRLRTSLPRNYAHRDLLPLPGAA